VAEVGRGGTVSRGHRAWFRRGSEGTESSRWPAGRPGLWCKAPPGAQALLLEADPARFFRPPYVGHKGWIGVWLDSEPDWQEIGFLVRRSFAMTAPKRLASLVVET
jgi:hypothetical protein